MIGNGRFCSSTDPCSPNPCPPGLPCVPLYERGTHSCGREDDDDDDTPTGTSRPESPCEPNPCHPGVECEVVSGGAAGGGDDRTFRCGECPEGTAGDGITCRKDSKNGEGKNILFF